MDSFIENHQIIFMNPGFTGLLAAKLSLMAGADIGVINEKSAFAPNAINYPKPFPSSGTFFPGDVDKILVNAGVTPMVWRREPSFRINSCGLYADLNSDDGQGGFILELAGKFPSGRYIWTKWIQEQFHLASQLLNRDNNDIRPRESLIVGASVAHTILELNLPDPAPFISFLDCLARLVIGKGLIQTDIRDFPLVLAGFLNGWHHPVQTEAEIRDILINNLKDDGITIFEIDGVESIQSDKHKHSLIRLGPYNITGAEIIAASELDRFRHPLKPANSGSITWNSWNAEISGQKAKTSHIGLFYSDSGRSPVNDNFATYHSGAGSDIMTISAPIEQRYFQPDSRSRLSSLKSRITSVIESIMECHIEIIRDEQSSKAHRELTAPGISQIQFYAEGTLWGDDFLARLHSAELLQRSLIGKLR